MSYIKQNRNKVESPFHFIGIGGSGMRPLAEYSHANNLEFSGSDINESPFLNELKKDRNVFIGHKPENIKGAKTLILSSAINENNPEYVEAIKNGINIAHRSDLLNFFLNQKKSIVVAGTHGKTSTSALLSHMLNELNQKPSAIVGGKLLNTDSFSLSGDGEYIVAEADESDGTFLKYNPFYSVITNIDIDHLDYYKNIENIVEAFTKFANNTSKDGSVLLCWDNEYCKDMAKNLERDFLSFGFSMGADVRCLEYKHVEEGLYIKIHAVYNTIEGIVPLIGKHNVLNVLSCIALAIKLKIPPQEALEALSNYKGVMRRTETIYEGKQVKIVDDYAHNPGKINAVISSLKTAYPEKKLWVIFENHRYSRLQSMYDEILHSLNGADRVFVAPIFAAGEEVDPNYTTQSISEDIKNILQINAEPYFNDKIIEYLKNIGKTDKVILLTVGAGKARDYGIEIRTQIDGEKNDKE